MATEMVTVELWVRRTNSTFARVAITAPTAEEAIELARMTWDALERGGNEMASARP